MQATVDQQLAPPVRRGPSGRRWSGLSPRILEVYGGALLTIAAVSVRIWLSARLYLNPDEACHLINATARQWDAFAHPPLLLWWLWLAAHVSEAEWWLRLLPSLAGGLAPAAAAFWLRRHVSPFTAWSLATLLAFAPILVCMTLQLRAYSLAILAVLLALIALDRAFTGASKPALAGHFAALYAGIFSEFSVAWVALAAGLYGLVRFVRTPSSRRLLPAWIAGQVIALLAYALLYGWIVSAWVGNPEPQTPHLGASGFQSGQNPATFVLRGFVGQFAYLTGGVAPGCFMAVLYTVGVVSWVRARDARVILAAAPYAVAAAALIGGFPFGPTRHTVVIGVASLPAVGVGIEALARRARIFTYAAPAILCAMLFWNSRIDPMDIPLGRWQKQGWDRATAQLRSAVPAGSIVITSEAVFHMLEASRVPRRQRPPPPPADAADGMATAWMDGLQFLAPCYSFAGLMEPDTRARVLEWIATVRSLRPTAPRAIWFLNGGWETGCYPADQCVIDGPELFLGRLDPYRALPWTP